MVGGTISHYKILGKLGEGGMGVVYRAEDTTLGRIVALKFLAQHLLEDQEASKRFHREAKAAAALHHPNVCPVYEIGSENGQIFLAMALIEGQTIEARIAEGPLRLEHAVDIAQQIAQGLQAAHEKKVVHRDIKPGNVMVDSKGHVTLMDFGLALLSEGSELSRAGTTIGTAAYMSPEQAQGTEVDHRTDIWALGCVLYEMVSGQRPFKGQYDQALLYEIVHEEPEPLTGVRTGIPLELEWIAGKCLAKDRDERYEHTDELLRDLRGLQKKLRSGKLTVSDSRPISQPISAETGPLPAYERPSEGMVQPDPSNQTAAARSLFDRRRPLLARALLVVTTLAVLVMAFFYFRGTPQETLEAPLRRFAVAPPAARGSGDSISDIAISPNGRHVAFVTGQGPNSFLWVQDLDREKPRGIEGTDGVDELFWSPGSDFICFVTRQEVRKVPTGGGPVVTVCRLPGNLSFGGTWSRDGQSIVFGAGTGAARALQSKIRTPSGPTALLEVASRGGSPEKLLDAGKAKQWQTVGYPHLLPAEADGRFLLFEGSSSSGETQVVLLNLDTMEGQVLLPGRRPIYSSTGHIIYSPADGSPRIWALPFSIESLSPTGQPFPIAENARRASISLRGTMAYLDAGSEQLISRDRGGNELATIGQPQEGISHVALSPDGRMVAVHGFENGNSDIWLHEVDRDIKTRLTDLISIDMRPIWSPTGEDVAFSAQSADNMNIFLVRADGATEARPFLATPSIESITDWSRDGKYLLYLKRTELSSAGDLWYLKVAEAGGTGESVPFLQSPADETAATLSPDGRFIAYISNESGRRELYVRPFPKGQGRWRISTNGARQARWRRDGKELFYIEEDTLVAVGVKTQPTFSADQWNDFSNQPTSKILTLTCTMFRRTGSAS